ncbi:GGDEF domain-containing phosphodiesterase [Mycolicibacterium arenosum]|uniref:GGDEF domain-containing phosphodiesterase n=1 Tax=Mycolicibacterium arenosum TaxID=2952157 RepID=A0ABT1M3C2_9MYCO|nr:GGDEF domain-containing phosphodiesterase [Mycolicibacterium sp. CAU 1645]MCP9273655.1 GGDEF domain-containing phosphodiesterase [Mycolicibacterium sp. CAU 1645]
MQQFIPGSRVQPAFARYISTVMPRRSKRDRAVGARGSSVLARDALMSRTAGTLFLFGGAVNIVVLVGDSPGSFAAGVALAAASAATGLWLVLRRGRLSPLLLHGLLVFATLLIAAEAIVATDPFAAILLATLSVFVAVAAFFFAWPQLAGHVGFVAICMITAMAAHPAVPWQTGAAIASFVAALTVINKLFLDMAVEAEFDALTGLPNRRGFDRHLASWLARAQAVDGTALILVSAVTPADRGVSIDADATLIAVLDSWRPFLNSGERLGRRDADQIAIFQPGTTGRQAHALVDRLRGVTTADCAAGLTTVREGDSAARLIARAEAALLRAKLAGNGRTVADVADVDSDASLLRRALADGVLEIGYQPIVANVPGHPLVAIEALLRWPDAVRPALSPTETVHVAERSGVAAALDVYVLSRACRDAGAIQRMLDAELMLNVNLSAISLVDGDLVARIDSTLSDTDWPAEQLTIEITEEMLDLRGGAVVETLRRLRTRGVRIAVDDFGTGYSSLSRLQALPVDMLKLDKSITDSVRPSSDETPALLRAVAAMARALALPVTVEGVETRRQMHVLADVGFERAQGFLFGCAKGVDAYGSNERWWDPDDEPADAQQG